MTEVGRKRKYRNAAERQKAYRERKRQRELEKKRMLLEDRIRQEGFATVEEYVRYVALKESGTTSPAKEGEPEDVYSRDGNFDEKTIKKRKEQAELLRTMKLEADYREAAGLSGVYRIVDNLKRHARKTNTPAATFLEFKAYDERQVWILFVYPNGELKWNKIKGMCEKIAEEDQIKIPDEIISKFRGSKVLKPLNDLTQQLKAFLDEEVYEK